MQLSLERKGRRNSVTLVYLSASSPNSLYNDKRTQAYNSLLESVENTGKKIELSLLYLPAALHLPAWTL
ncbi:hypothetical protein AVEN_254711-1, partial [Araneus ventricosus]